MRKESIKSHIDRKILNKIKTSSYDEVRAELLQTCQNFMKKVEVDFTTFNRTEDNISKIKDVRSRYLSWYILYAEKRIIDLFKIERNYNFGFTPHKNFKLLLFKEEKLERPRS